MKKKQLIFMGLLGIGIYFLGGCSKVGFDTYDVSESNIYFGMENTKKSQKNVFVDTTVFSFGEYENTSDTTIYIRVNAMGGLSEVERTFEYEVVDSMTTAKVGEFYELPEKTGIIPAGSTCGYIPVIIHNCNSMKDRATWFLVLQLKPNQNFNLDLKQEYVDNNNQQYVELTRHWVGMSARIQKPASWVHAAEQYFLEFSSDKYKLINQLCHLTKSNWDNMQYYLAEPYWIVVRNYLQKKIDQNDPVMERNERTGRLQIMKVKGLTGVV